MPESMDQVPFFAAEFAENPEPRCPCILLLDTSGSMSGEPIRELNLGLHTFKDELMADAMAVKRVELAVVTFGPVHVVQEFQTADVFEPPNLTSQGATPMGAAIELALEMLRTRKEIYKSNGISYYRPWVFMVTDGAPTDSWQRASQLIKEAEEARAVSFFSVGVQGADLQTLSKITVRQPLHLKGLRFRDLFSWLSNSLGAVSRSTPGDTVPLQNPATPDGWATSS